VAAIEALRPFSAPISVDGGLTRNPWFCRFLADALGREIVLADEPETTAVGTALLAAEGAGLALDRPRSGSRIAPRPQPAEWRERFAEARRMVQAYGAQAPRG
jgi:glycerol kinase